MTRKKGRAQPKTYSKGRVKRGPAPIARLTRSTYRKALPELRRDFEDRCAYCMRHIGTETEMHIDHFDPRRKKDKCQVYANLFLADAHCNGAKSNMWPTDEDARQGCRFLNCCDEQDYGAVIFEDPKTHELIGTTPAACYHIAAIDLNDPGLVEERRRRALLSAKLEMLEERSKNAPELADAIKKIRDMASDQIPDIPAPPRYWTIMDEPLRGL